MNSARETAGAFSRWWTEQEGEAHARALGLPVEPARRLSLGAYLKGQIDGADRAGRIIREALADLHAGVPAIPRCRWCRTALGPSPEPDEADEAIVQALGRLCVACAAQQEQARDLME